MTTILPHTLSDQGGRGAAAKPPRKGVHVMNEFERLYYEKELADIKEFCIKHGLAIRYNNRDYYLYENKIYDMNMDVIVECAENGFLDLFEYFEYFATPDI